MITLRVCDLWSLHYDMRQGKNELYTGLCGATLGFSTYVLFPPGLTPLNYNNS